MPEDACSMYFLLFCKIPCVMGQIFKLQYLSTNSKHSQCFWDCVCIPVVYSMMYCSHADRPSYW